MDSSIVVAIISGTLTVIGTITVSILEIKRAKENAKPVEQEAAAKIIEMALNLNKQEFETIRIINESLKSENIEMKKEIKELREQLENLEQRYEDCIKKGEI